MRLSLVERLERTIENMTELLLEKLATENKVEALLEQNRIRTESHNQLLREKIELKAANTELLEKVNNLRPIKAFADVKVPLRDTPVEYKNPTEPTCKINVSINKYPLI